MYGGCYAAVLPSSSVRHNYVIHFSFTRTATPYDLITIGTRPECNTIPEEWRATTGVRHFLHLEANTDTVRQRSSFSSSCI